MHQNEALLRLHLEEFVFRSISSGFESFESLKKAQIISIFFKHAYFSTRKRPMRRDNISAALFQTSSMYLQIAPKRQQRNNPPTFVFSPLRPFSICRHHHLGLAGEVDSPGHFHRRTRCIAFFGGSLNWEIFPKLMSENTKSSLKWISKWIFSIFFKDGNSQKDIVR